MVLFGDMNNTVPPRNPVKVLLTFFSSLDPTVVLLAYFFVPKRLRQLVFLKSIQHASSFLTNSKRTLIEFCYICLALSFRDRRHPQLHIAHKRYVPSAS